MAAGVRRFLSERYPPGGTVGYLRWVVTSGELKKGEIEGVNRTLRRTQRGFRWGIRVVLSIVLFVFGVGSQTWPLRLARERYLRASDVPEGTEDD